MELDGMSIAVYTMLCARADANGKCFPSLTKLAKDAGVSKDTVVRRMKILEQKGLLSIEKGNSVKSNRYQLLVAESDKVVAESDYPSSRERLGVVAESATNDNHINDNHLTIIKNEKKLSLGEHKKVKITNEEKQKLYQKIGENDTELLIEELDGYLASTGKKYKSHYAVIQNWYRRNSQKKKESYKSIKLIG